MPLNKFLTLLLAAFIAVSISFIPTHAFTSNSKKLQYTKVDLNKDGIKDIIKIQNVSGISVLSVNNESIKLNPNGYPYCSEHFRIIDIKSSDKFKEIQIDFEEDGGYTSTGFYYYDGKSIIKMGYTVGVYKSTNGKGKVSIAKWCGFLEYNVDYQLTTDHTLQKVIKNVYPVSKKSRCLIPITLQKSTTHSKKILNLKKGEQITILGISFKKNNKGINDHWLLIKNSKNKSGWVNADQLTQDNNLSIDQVFEGLYYSR